MKDENTYQFIWDTLYGLIRNPYGVAGVMGNLYAESGLRANNLQNSFGRVLEMTDEEYTKAVNDGTYENFVNDGAGYGLAQWTFRARKQNLLAYAKTMHMSIDDLSMQLAFLCLELCNYSALLEILKNTGSVQEASDAVLTMYEKPANITQEKKDRRARLSDTYYKTFKDVEQPEIIAEDAHYHTLQRGSKGDDVVTLQKNLKELGYFIGDKGADGQYGPITAAAVAQFQSDHGLYKDGKAGAVTQDLLLYVLLKSHDKTPKPTYTVTISGLNDEEADWLFRRYEQYPVTIEEDKG